MIFIGFIRYMLVFMTGGYIYGAIEVLFRGHTHWTMLITGGLCLCAIYFVDTHTSLPLLVKAGIGCMIITFAEFSVGILVNRVLEWNVWDYSNMSFNIMGQICPLFSLFWFLLSIPAIYLCRIMQGGILLPITNAQQ